MNYYVRTISARASVNHFGRLDFVTRTEFFKTSSEAILSKANKGKHYKYVLIEGDLARRFADELRFLKKTGKAGIVYFHDDNDYYKIHTAILPTIDLKEKK